MKSEVLILLALITEGSNDVGLVTEQSPITREFPRTSHWSQLATHVTARVCNIEPRMWRRYLKLRYAVSKVSKFRNIVSKF